MVAVALRWMRPPLALSATIVGYPQSVGYSVGHSLRGV